MTLEFNKLVNQVYKMGAMLTELDFDLSQILELARERFAMSGDLDAVRERIEWVRRSDVSRYRGAAPLPFVDIAEAMNVVVDAPEVPERATIIAVDGSQVYPDELSPVHYYLINIGAYIYKHGLDDHTPEQHTFPDLKFHHAYVHDRYGRIIGNGVVDDRRTLEEMKMLAEISWEYRRPKDVPTIALYDNRLMYLPTTDDTPDADTLMSDYLGRLVQLHDADAILAGYIDNPYRSKRFMQFLYLMSMESETQLKERQRELMNAGDLEGLYDQRFFQVILKNGQRSAIMVQNSPQNKVFKDRGENYEIAYFYLKVHNSFQSKVVRVDLPMWVARDRQKVDALHSVLLDQCRLQGRNPYPYAITRADELAWVGGKDKSKLEEMINVQVRRIRDDAISQTLPAKTRGKELARSDKRYHSMQGERLIDDR